MPEYGLMKVHPHLEALLAHSVDCPKSPSHRLLHRHIKQSICRSEHHIPDLDGRVKSAIVVMEAILI